jgi:tetratricopeptide (TPR) repeat protein
VLWDVEMLAGDPAAAEQHLRAEVEILPASWTFSRSWVAAALAHAMCAQERYEEAERLTEASEEAAGDWVLNQVLWRGARAKALARNGDLGTAERLAREAASLAARTDALNLRGNALLDLAEVIRLASRIEEAAPLVEGALRLYQRKGNAVMLRKAGGLRQDLSRM